MRIQNTNINIRVSKKLRDTFIDTAKKNGTSYSKVLRSLINDYINKSNKTGEYK